MSDTEDLLKRLGWSDELIERFVEDGPSDQVDCDPPDYEAISVESSNHVSMVLEFNG